jgi:hypothetical protein
MYFKAGGGLSMEWMMRTDAILLMIATYVAVMTLVRMMRRRHDELVADVKQQVDARRKRGKVRKQSGTDQTRGAA